MKVRNSFNNVMFRVLHSGFPTLKDFIRREKVIAMYRCYLRKVYNIDESVYSNDLKKSLQDEIRSEFKKNGLLSDPRLIKSALIEGQRNLQKLDGYVLKRNDETPLAVITDDDIKGRVGEGWPWNN